MGGGRGCYAGQPLTFRCAKCNRCRNYKNLGDRTGRTREQHAEGMNFHHWGIVAYEYECNTCGHKGWSRHPMLAQQAAVAAEHKS